MAKDIVIPKMYCQLRDTLLQSGWIISHSDVNDTYIVLIPPEGTISCILHYMPEAKTVYPNGSFLLRLRSDTWKIQTDTCAIDENTSKDFIRKLTQLNKIYEHVKFDLFKEVF